MMNLVFFLEEPSAEAMLKGLLPKLLPDNIFPRYIVFEGKRDLEKQIELKLRAWRAPDTKFVILRDKDSGDCYEIKSSLLKKCKNAGKPDCLVRIACYELESWYLGDLKAVEKGLEISDISKKQSKAKYRNPDNLNNAADELIRLTNKKYQKISGSRNIAPHLSLDKNNSHSFRVFLSGVMGIIEKNKA